MDEALVVLAADERFAPLIAKYGRPTLVREMGHFQSLVRSIIYQQVSGKAAASIMARFVALFPAGAFPMPARVAAMPIEALRGAGLSNQKVSYVKDLARKFVDGTVEEARLSAMGNDEVLAHLVAVKGVGVWTAHMFLIFTLGRLDVLPVGDLGVRKGFQVVYGMKALPTQKQMERRAKPWRKFASVASWYFWQVADDAVHSRHAHRNSAQKLAGGGHRAHQKSARRREAAHGRPGHDRKRRVE